MHVVTTRRHYKDRVYETHLLRRSYREGGKVKNQTVGNLSHLPPHIIELVRGALKGERYAPAATSHAGEAALELRLELASAESSAKLIAQLLMPGQLAQLPTE